jgi:hypothetical protein
MSLINTAQVTDEIIQELVHAIEQLRYGSVEVTVHDGRVTQIERREKVRFNQTPEQATQKIKPTASAAAKH